MYDIDDKSKAIFNVQRMLSALSRHDGRIPAVIPDGIYGDETRHAVSVFRSICGLPAGTDVDYPTFTRLVHEFRQSERRNARARGLNAFPTMLADGGIALGEYSPVVYIIQAILITIATVWDDFDSVEVNGVFDEKTKKALDRVCEVYGLEKTDKITKEVWNALTHEYERAVDSRN